MRVLAPWSPSPKVTPSRGDGGSSREPRMGINHVMVKGVRIEPGVIIRDKVELGKGVVVMMVG